MIILHGNNQVTSRQKLSAYLNDFNGEKISLDGEKLNLTQFIQATESGSLFGQDKLIIIENLFSRRPSKEKDTLTEKIKAIPENIIFWEGKAIDGRSLIAFKKAKIEKYDVSSSLFKFLDTFYPGNIPITWEYLQETLKNEAPELVFSLLVRQIRLLIIARDLGAKGLDKMAPWQKEKLVKQANKFTLEKLLKYHQALLAIDIRQKTGQASFTMQKQLDLLVASL